MNEFAKNETLADLSTIDRALLNYLQVGIPVVQRPFANIASELKVDEDYIIAALKRLLDDGYLTRFGPMYNVERMGGEFTLVATKVPADEYSDIAAKVNSFPQVAHNYEREHDLNMWFVTATNSQEETARVLEQIVLCTGLKLYAMPKEKEYFLELKITI